MEDKSWALVAAVIGAILAAASVGGISWLRLPPPPALMLGALGCVLFVVGMCGMLIP